MTSIRNRTYSYFPGCSLQVTNKAYDISTRRVAEALGVEMIELDDWNCCGATAYMSIREKQSFVLSTRNLALAEEQGHDLITVCNSCYVVLSKTVKYMEENEELRQEVRGALQAGDMDYKGEVRVRHFLDIVVRDLGKEVIESKIVQPLTGLRVAPYPGCQLGRPFGEIDDPEFPNTMDQLLGWLGAEVIDFPLKAKCCGGMMMTTVPDIGEVLTGKILQTAKQAGADCIATACPLCQMNLEGYQKNISKTIGEDISIPVLYFTQLIGSALGLQEKDVLLKDSLTDVESLPLCGGCKA